MPLIVRDTSYPLPNFDYRTGPTGAEIDTVETHFGVDWYDLMTAAEPVKEGEERPRLRPGCTRNRAMFALAWIAMHRVDPSLTLPGVMEEYGRNELRFVVDGTPAEKVEGESVPTPAGDEETEPAATS